MKLAAIIGMISLSAHAEEGYFLSLKQKGQLIGLGKIEDSAGTWYDIWVCPGYVEPVKESLEGFKSAGRNLREYATSEKYSKLAEGSKDCFRWAFKDCLQEYTLQGTGKAWKKYFAKAEERTERRLFGWWMSYPFALIQSGMESAWRLSSGTIGTVSGTVSGLFIVPAYHMTNSAIKASGNGVIKGVLLPASEIVWNTAISPLLALTGEKPSPGRSDGFWVRILESESTPKTSQADPVSEGKRIIKESEKEL